MFPFVVMPEASLISRRRFELELIPMRLLTASTNQKMSSQDDSVKAYYQVSSKPRSLDAGWLVQNGRVAEPQNASSSVIIREEVVRFLITS